MTTEFKSHKKEQNEHLSGLKSALKTDNKNTFKGLQEQQAKTMDELKDGLKEFEKLKSYL